MRGRGRGLGGVARLWGAVFAIVGCRPAPEVVEVVEVVDDRRAREPVGCDDSGKPWNVEQWYSPTLPGCIAEILDPGAEITMMPFGTLLPEVLMRGVAWMAGEPRVRGFQLSRRIAPADLGQLPRLRYLDILTPWAEEVAMLPRLVELEYLDVRRWNACDRSDGFAGLPGLRGLGLWGCGLVEGWAAMRRLERLDLSGVDLPDLQMLAELTRLRELNVIDSRIADPRIPASGLRRLRLHASVRRAGDPSPLRPRVPLAGRVSSYDLRALSELRALEELALYHASAFGHGEVLAKLPALRRLATDDADLLPYIARVRGLERLDLGRAAGVRPEGLRFLRGCKARRLTHLALPGTVVVGAVSELVLARGLQTLVVVSRDEPGLPGALAELRERRPGLTIVVRKDQVRDSVVEFPALYDVAVDPWRVIE